jgi:hypothetical protein
MASRARLAVGNQDGEEPAPWGHRSITGDEHLRRLPVVNVGRKKMRMRTGQGRGLEERAHHQEAIDEVGEDGGGLQRLESKKFSAMLETESAKLSSVQGALGRFLCWGGRGRRGASSGTFSSARGALGRRRHGEVATAAMGCFSSLFLSWRRGKEGAGGGLA